MSRQGRRQTLVHARKRGVRPRHRAGGRGARSSVPACLPEEAQQGCGGGICGGEGGEELMQAPENELRKSSAEERQVLAVSGC